MNNKAMCAARTLLLCGAALLTSSCSLSGKARTQAGANAAGKETPINVAVAKVRREDISKQMEQREVLIGLESPSAVEIVSGLAENELVVIGNQSQLKPGQSVTFKELTPADAKGGR